MLSDFDYNAGQVGPPTSMSSRIMVAMRICRCTSGSKTFNPGIRWCHGAMGTQYELYVMSMNFGWL
jgi:hypothetical protein